jgi:uncharacterized phage infection (PIP) family protein YhgE
MAAKNKLKSKIKPMVKKDHFEVLLENMNDNIKLVAEGQMAFREEVDQRFTDFQKETRSNFKTIFDFRDETRSNFKTLFDFRDETRSNFKTLFDFHGEARSNFKTAFDYLSRIDDELQDIKNELKLMVETKADKNELNALTQRVTRLERDLDECKEAFVAKK